MPVSKKPRRKQSKPQSSKRTSSVVALPDRRAMEGFLSAIGGRQTEDAMAAAQDLMYSAWDQSSKRARIDLARKALAISPLCADAYVLLAEEEAKSAQEALEFFRKGVEAGEQALGPTGFKRYAGHFWGFLETRPYMRARAGLAATLNTLGEMDAAIGHYRDMLRLNPNDNQGIRYVLAGCLMKRGDTEVLKELFEKYDEDGSALWLYSRALVAFRENKGSDVKANEFATDALRANRHVPAVLNGSKKAKPSTSGYLTMGGEDEAAHYFEEWGFDWVTTPGAIDWLTKIAAEGTPTRTKRVAEH
jgi:tetratricopeptide (TPR) repeat protein